MDAQTDTQLWSATYDRKLDDIFAIRDEITDRIASELTIELGRLMPRSPRTDARAYDLTLQARSILERIESQADVEQAAELVSRALAIDPDYVPAILEQGYVNHYLMFFGLMDEEDESRAAGELLARVLALDPDNGHALALRAWDHWERDLALEAAAGGFSEALAADPADAETLWLAGIFARSIGRPEASAAALADLVSRWDELGREELYLVPEVHAWTGEEDAAFEWLERAYEASERYGVHGFWFQRIVFLPVWRHLHGDPRWTAARERAGMSEARLEALELVVPPHE